MVNTTLRAYLDELNLLLEQEALEEVIGHCRHILQHFPKNVETYRLLGRALLEKGRHDEAADVFQRVLSALPDDFVSHLGLSSVAEDQNQTPTAIWHLERAYEQDPNNMALQGELKRLYEANGSAPERVQLTQGALIRIYAKGRLYEQANRELLSALAQQPNRLDLLLLQADVLWSSDHPVEGGEIALRILKKLPDSIEANCLLASLWLKSGRPSEAEPFVSRLEQLDPFLAWQTVHPDGKQVPADAFQLSHLDWDARAAAALATDVPDWVNAISNVFDAPDSVSLSGGVNNWLDDTPAPAPEPVRPAARPQAAPPVAPDWIDEPEPAAQAQNDVPDWFKEPAVQDTESSTSSASAVLPDWFEEAVNTPDEAAAPAWAETAQPDEQLPSGFTDLLMGTPKTDSEPEVQPSSIPIPDWLAELEAAPAAPAEPVDATSWLMTGPLPPLEEATSSTPEASADAEIPAEPEAPAVPEASAEPALDWLSDFVAGEPPVSEAEPEAFAGPEAPVEADVPAEPAAAVSDMSWLNDFAPAEQPLSEAQPEVSAEQDVPAEPAAAVSDMSWLNDFAPVEQPPSEAEPAQVDTPDLDWLSAMGTVAPEAPAEPAVPAGPELDWLSDLRPADQPPAQAEPEASAGADTSTSVDVSAEPAVVSDMDWLNDFAPAEQPPSEAEPAQAEMPDLDWLSAMGTVTPEVPLEPAVPAGPELDWLSDLRPADQLPAQAGPEASAEAESFAETETSAESAAVPGLDWLSDLRPAEQPPSEAEPAQAEMSDLDWLGAMGTVTPEVPLEPAVPAGPELDWLSDLRPADQAPAESEVAAEPAQVDAGSLDWLSAMSSVDLSAPSAQPGEPELPEASGQNLEKIPDDWLSSPVDFGEDTGIVTEGDPMAWLRPYTDGTPALSDEPVEAESELPSDEAPVQDEAPAWLSAMRPSTPPGPMSAPVSLDDLDFGDLGATAPDSLEPLDASSPAQPAEEDWLSSIGETPTSVASPSTLDWLVEPKEQADEHPLELEDDWLASFEIGGQPQPEDRPEPASAPGESADMPAEPAAPSADWLGSLSLNQPGIGEPLPQSTDWLGSLADEVDTSPAGEGSEPQFQPSAEPSAVDDWMASLGIAESTPADEIPGWMNEPAATGKTAESETPDWLATPEAQDHFDNLLKHATEKANEPRATGDTGILAPGGEMPDWLSAFSEDAAPLAPEQPVEIPSDQETPEASQTAEANGFSPDWLTSDISLETLAASSQTELPLPVGEGEEESVAPGTIPDWLSAIAPVSPSSVDDELPLSAGTPPGVPVKPLADLDFAGLDREAPHAEAEPADALDWLSMPAVPSAEPDAEPAEATESDELALPANLVNTNVSVPAGKSVSRFKFDRPPAWLRKKKA